MASFFRVAKIFPIIKNIKMCFNISRVQIFQQLYSWVYVLVIHL